jgi:uncharacterized membrane protein YfcA
MLAIGFALAALVGLSLGLVGGGGSILTVPIFVYVLGFEAKMAIAMSLPVVGGASLIGAISHWKAGNVQLRTAGIFGAITMAGAYAGARLAALLTGSTQLSIFAIVMLAAAVSMLRSARKDRGATAVPSPEPRPIAFWLLIPVALGVGLLTGLVGVGGGFLIVPALVVLARVPMKQAVGTSLVVIAMNSMSGFAGYIGQVTLPWTFMLTFMAIAAGGILLGTRLIQYVSQSALKLGFAVFPLTIGALILVNNLKG